MLGAAPQLQACKFTLILRCASGSASDSNGHSKADTDKEVFFGRVGKPGDDTYHMPVSIQQRATRVARVHRRIDLNHVVQLHLAIGGLESAVQTRDDAGAH